jgi:Ni/Co efflux regulator RcnB
MKTPSFCRIGALAALAVSLAVTPAAFAKNDKHEDGPPGHSKEHKHKDKHKGKHKDKHVTVAPVTIGGYFQEPQRVRAHDYYVAQGKRGHCPPGLAKKNNGCMPPGQAKKWNVGQPLPRDVVYYPVPQPLIVQLGAPPAGHRYVRVASDILLVTVGTMMVVDGMSGLLN